MRGCSSTGSRRSANSTRNSAAPAICCSETARHLAVRMSFEDLIRVAQAKIDPARMQRIGQELGAKAGEPYHVTEFLKPGIEEMCQVLPPALARRIIAFSEKRGWLDRVHVGMYVKTTSVSGYLRFWFLAKLRPLRRFMHRYVEEQAQIEHLARHDRAGREAVARRSPSKSPNARG